MMLCAGTLTRLCEKKFPHHLSPCFALAAAVLQRLRPDGGDVPWRGAYGKCGAHKCVKAIVPKSSERVEGMFADEATLDSVEGPCCCGIDVRQIASARMPQLVSLRQQGARSVLRNYVNSVSFPRVAKCAAQLMKF